MYRIEMYVETGNWSVRVPADRKQAAKIQNDLLRHNQYQWNRTGGVWVTLGGRYPTVEAAELAIARMMECGSSAKPKAFRVVW